MRTFPTFIDVTRRPPLIFGGGDMAAAKARLLAKRAPRIEVATTNPGEAVYRLAGEGVVEIVNAPPTISSVRGRPLVIAATSDTGLNADISAIAKSLGVPVNVPDEPALCSFILPAIVDRDEVTIAISTDGQAPVLAQRLRGWLERKLDPKLGALAKIAGQYRDRVARALPDGTTRRRLWESVFNGEIAAAVFAGREGEARQLICDAIDTAQSTPPAPARVILVGAGPGDPDLLTVKAVRAIKSADTILYDDLVGPGVLDLARREADLIPVGKRGRRLSTPQKSINELLGSLAKPGHTIVRLKGGDPFVFGRGGEEISVLRNHGTDIDVEVIPGITAATAAAASTQIPLTDRRYARTVTFISGHGPGGGLPDFSHLDLAALRDGGHTLAVYMAIATAHLLADALTSAGWNTSCPVLVVENASLQYERRVRTTIAGLANGRSTLGLKGPAVMLIGEVAGLDVAGSVIEEHEASAHTRELAHA